MDCHNIGHPSICTFYFHSIGQSPCISSEFCYLHLLLLSLLAAVTFQITMKEMKICASIPVQKQDFLVSKDANGLEDGEWELPCGPLKGPEDSKSNNFVPVVQTLHHAFQLICNKNIYIWSNFFVSRALNRMMF